ncbi:hypothetical protein FIBSPDRAFT_878991 [Athelia psychrophila]|uniref:Uncharacterized protein n=1 Tax=Athelia psychrophila TaxID=1759441 RepID=A0A167UH26_9AGAM|nr:hypothetical protein FIBSPDRAFT_878991 [Fibularhizoctonia sp. CBS 109695]
MALHPQSLVKQSDPSSPPPAYSESTMPGPGSTSRSYPVADQSSASRLYADQGFFAPLSSPPMPTHHLFGPTPIAQQQEALLPYYDSRSPYAVGQASSRARWRFIGAVFYALIIWMALLVVLGVEIPEAGRWITSASS